MDGRIVCVCMRSYSPRTKRPMRRGTLSLTLVHLLLTADSVVAECLAWCSEWTCTQPDMCGSCEPCMPGTYLCTPGASAESSCVECMTGKYSNIAKSCVCLNCSYGTYSTVAGASSSDSSCRNCTNSIPKYGEWTGSWGRTYISGNTSKYVTWTPLNATSLLNQTSTLTNVTCTGGLIDCHWKYFCPPGMFLANTSGCAYCPAGTYRETGGANSVSDCQNCPAGSWRSAEGGTAAVKCT
jgi:hypothetical protein